MAFRTNQIQVDGSINIDGSIFQWNVPFTGGGSQWTTTGSDIYYNTGKVGIGVSVPISPFQIQNNGDNFPQVRINASVGENASFPDSGLRLRSSSISTGLHADIFVKGVSINETGRMGFRVPYSNERMSILSDGKIGIGTANPSSNLHIYGDGGTFASFTISGSGEQGIRVLNTAGIGAIRNSMKWANRNDTDWTWIIYTDTLATGVHDNWQLQNRNGAVMNCTSLGRVGLATSTFFTRESSNGTAYNVHHPIDPGTTASTFGMGLFNTPRLVFGGTNTGGNYINTAEIYIENQSLTEGSEYAKMHLRTKPSTGGQTTALTIDASQYIGIGTTSPLWRFTMVDNRSGDVGAFITNNHATGYGVKLRGGDAARYALQVSGYDDTTALTVYGTGAMYPALGIYLPNGSASVPSLSFASDTDTGFYWTTSGKIHVTNNGTNNFLFDVSSFHADGNIVGYSTSVSDVRLKRDIINIDQKDPIKIIQNLRGVEYTDIRKGGKHSGLIAQETENTLPHVITEHALLNLDPSTLYKTINYVEIIPYLIEAIKKQQEEIEELKLKIQ